MKNTSKSDAAPVLPQANPRDHSVKKSERGRSPAKGKGQDRPRSSTPVDTSKIGCACHFYGKNGCSKGDKCKFSHADKHKSSARKPGDIQGKNSRSKSPNPRSKSPNDRKDQPCWAWQKGVCKFGDKCQRQHHAAPAAKQEAKPKPKPKPAVPAFLNCDDIQSGDDVEQSQKAAPVRIKPNKHVTFDMIVDIHNFTCDPGNELRYKPSSQARKVHTEAVDVEVTASKESLQVSEVANKVAHAKGIMMSNFDRNDRETRRVRMNKETMIEITVDMSDLTFQENIVHADGSVDRWVGPLAASAEKYDGPPIRFIMDTGCGHDLISKEKVRLMNLDMRPGSNSVNFTTANGIATTSDIKVAELPVESEVHVLESTPSDFSVGKRCMGRGVLLGDQVKIFEAALFQDLGNSPATFEASRWADFYMDV